MILITILAIIAAIMVTFAVTMISVGGAAFGILFSDVIVCVVLIALFIRWLFKRKFKK